LVWVSPGIAAQKYVENKALWVGAEGRGISWVMDQSLPEGMEGMLTLKGTIRLPSL
jgi:hypothetical protein